MRLLREIGIQGLLSFGEIGVNIELKDLNVLIGPNGSGKSNLLEVISLLRAAPRDILSVLRHGGGISEWLWKGSSPSSMATITTVVHYPETPEMPLRYHLGIGRKGQTAEITEEHLANVEPYPGFAAPYLFLDVKNSRGVLNPMPVPRGGISGETRKERRLEPQDLDPAQSVLAQRKDPDEYPEITYLGKRFSEIHLYREWNLGRDTKPRQPQQTDLPEDFLLEDASNLGMVLNDLQHRGTLGTVIHRLQDFYERVNDISVKLHGGTAQLFVHEHGLSGPVPATRLSDGTLRYLCLLAILCHPAPPPLICIEEPELGLHPDILPSLAELLIDASTRTQLLITTHSEILVSALSDHPESIVVCEYDGETKMRRLDGDLLKEWLKTYSLGELWRKGELGGNRW